ncbi:MAG TPA: hypothetical protein V6C50_02435 [Crinalium sp.]
MIVSFLFAINIGVKQMLHTPVEKQADSQPDESLGVEQLPQSELEASPGDRNQQAFEMTNANSTGNATATPASPPLSPNAQENDE